VHIENITLPEGDAAVFKMTPLSPETGMIPLRRWGLIGARAGAWARLALAGGTEAVYMDLVPRDVVFDGDEAVYAPITYKAVVFGGLRTHDGFQGKGYATVLMMKVIEVLKKEGEIDFICNFVLDERLSFFLERGWEAVDEDVKVTILQPGNKTVLLPDKFTFVVHKLKDSVDMPTETVEYKGLPA